MSLPLETSGADAALLGRHDLPAEPHLNAGRPARWPAAYLERELALRAAAAAALQSGGHADWHAFHSLLAGGLADAKPAETDHLIGVLAQTGVPNWPGHLLRALAGKASLVPERRALLLLLAAAPEAMPPAKAVAAVEAAEAAGKALPPEWWMAVYCRLFRQRLPLAAWAAKRATARVDAAAASPKALIGPAVFLRDAALLARVAAAPEANARIGSEALLALGRLDEARARRSLRWTEQDRAWAARVAGCSLAVVGPAPNALGSGPAIDGHDLVVRTNYVRSPRLAEAAAALGTRTDVAFYNNAFPKNRLGDVAATLDAEPELWAAFKSREIADEVEARQTMKRQHRHYRTALGRHRATGFALRHVVQDLLLLGPGRITVFGADFFLGRHSHVPGYFDPVSRAPARRPGQMRDYISHDVLDCWQALKAWREHGWIEADAVLGAILDLTEADFALALAARDRPKPG
jgi:hypothetical protein